MDKEIKVGQVYRGEELRFYKVVSIRFNCYCINKLSRITLLDTSGMVSNIDAEELVRPDSVYTLYPNVNWHLLTMLNANKKFLQERAEYKQKICGLWTNNMYAKKILFNRSAKAEGLDTGCLGVKEEKVSTDKMEINTLTLEIESIQAEIRKEVQLRNEAQTRLSKLKAKRQDLEHDKIKAIKKAEDAAKAKEEHVDRVIARVREALMKVPNFEFECSRGHHVTWDGTSMPESEYTGHDTFIFRT